RIENGLSSNPEDKDQIPIGIRYQFDVSKCKGSVSKVTPGANRRTENQSLIQPDTSLIRKHRGPILVISAQRFKRCRCSRTCRRGGFDPTADDGILRRTICGSTAGWAYCAKIQ